MMTVRWLLLPLLSLSVWATYFLSVSFYDKGTALVVGESWTTRIMFRRWYRIKTGRFPVSRVQRDDTNVVTTIDHVVTGYV